MKLIDIIEVFIAGDWGEETYSKETPCAVTCVRGADIIPISEYDFSAIPVRYINQQAYAKKCLQVGDIIIEKSGGSPTQSTGRVSLVSQELLDHAGAVICSNFCTAFRVKKGWIPLYVYYYLQFIYNLGAFFNFEGKTSGIKNLQLDAAFAAIPIEDISESIQNNIVAILQGLERKIAINRQINQNLEAMAKQLYDYWFVQFDFPNEEGKPYKSSGGKMVWNEKLKREIPKDWKVTNIGNILGKVISTPRLSTNEYLADGIYPVIDQTTEVYYAGFTNRKEAVVGQYPAVVFGDHSCAVKYVNFPFVRGADGTQVMLSNNANISIEYLYFVVKNIKIGKGYARHYSFLKEQLIVFPSNVIAGKFEKITQNLMEQITRNRKENQELTKLRNELLPLLMNGQVSVNSDLSLD